ncbi:MAG: histidine kinase N-terminal 7TM domain-containing protein [Anaerolineae bacterium]
MGEIFPLLMASLVGIGINVGLGLYAWRQNRSVARLFAIQSFAQAVYVIAFLLELTSAGLTAKTFWDDFQWYPALVAGFAFLLFALVYINVHEKTVYRVRWLLLGLFIVLSILTATADIHGLLRSHSIVLREGSYSVLIYQFGPLSTINTLFIYATIFSGLVLLITRLPRSRSLYRRQITLVVLGCGVEVLGTILTLMGVTYVGQRDLSPIFMPLSSSIIAYALFRYRFLDVVPIARGTILENMPDIVIILDEARHVVDVNAAARKLSGYSANEAIGKPFDALIPPEWHEIVARYRTMEGVTIEDEITLSVHGKRMYFTLTLTRLLSAKGALRGSIIVLRDVSGRKEAEEQVHRRSAELDSARMEAEHFFAVSRLVNRAQTYTDIVKAVSTHYPDLTVNIILSVFENLDFQSATYFDVLAVRSAGSNVIVRPNVRMPVDYIRDWIGDNVTVIDDVGSDPRIMQPSPEFYTGFRTQAILLAALRLGDRIIGMLGITSPVAKQHTDADVRYVRTVADIVAAAVDRIRLYHEEVQTAERLRAVDRMKSQFLASMSHELRTPLNAILNFTEFVSMGLMGPINERQADALQKSLTSGKHLLSLINDVLDITKIESGMMTLFVEANVDLIAELEQMTATAQTLLQGKPVTYTAAIDPALPRVVADKRRVRQIILNLISNACKFTQEGSITLKAVQVGDDVLITVQDTGPGIAKEDREIIFEAFRQGEHGLQAAGGTGLGLAINKRLVEAHNGRMWVESEVGSGTTFSILLPIRSPALIEQMNAVSSSLE